MKRLLTAIAAVLAISAYGTPGNWTDSDGVRWYFDYSRDSATITGASGYSDTLNIPATVPVGSTQYPVETIGVSAFDGQEDTCASSIKTVVIPDSVREIESSAFTGGNFTSLTLGGERLNYIRSYAFYGCDKLESVRIPRNVVAIDAKAFCNCTSLSSVTFGRHNGSITMDPYDAFKNTPYLARVNANDNTADAITLSGSVGRVTACNDLATMQTYTGFTEQEYFKLHDKEGNSVDRSLWWRWTAPDGVYQAVFHTFGSYCNTVLGIYVKDGDEIVEVASNDDRCFTEGVDYFSFVSFDVTPGVTYYICVAGVADSDRSSGDITLSWQAANGFSLVIYDGYLLGFTGNCPTSLTIPNTVTVINSSAFDSDWGGNVENFKSVVIPESVYWIRDYAFAGCGQLKFTFNPGLWYIEDTAFHCCYALDGTTVELPWTVKSVTGMAFGSIGGTVTVKAPDTVENLLTSGVYQGTTLKVTYNHLPWNTEVRLYPNGGEFMVPTIRDNKGNSYALIEIARETKAWHNAITRKPIRLGYTFAGFWDDEYDDQYWNGNMDYVSESWGSSWLYGDEEPYPDGVWLYEGWYMNLTAHWQAKTYTVKFNAIAAGATLSTKKKTVRYDGIYGPLPVPVLDGYEFLGWFTERSGGTQVTETTKMTTAADHTLYARWKRAATTTYTVTFNPNSTGATTTESSRKVASGAKLGALPTASLAGYDFVGWFTAKSGGTQVTATTTVSANVTYYAHWKAKTYTVSFNAISAAATLTTKKKTVRYGGTYGALPVPGLDGYAFIGWFTERSGGTQVLDTTKVTAVADHTLFAHWKRVSTTCTVTFNANGGTVSPTSRKVASGAKLGTLPVPTLAGYDFVGWFTAKSGGTQITANTVVTKDVTYYAHWQAKTYTVSFNAISASATLTTKKKTVRYGGTYGTLPVPVLDGYAFLGWFTERSGGTQVTDATKVTTAADHMLYARWKRAAK